MVLHRVFGSRVIPATMIAAGVALGCMSSPSPTDYERFNAPGRLDKRYSDRVQSAVVPSDPRELRIIPLGLRAQYDGLYVDALLLGQAAPRAAAIFNEHLRSGNILNATIAVRRIAPDPRPLILKWDRPKSLLAGEDAIGYRYNERDNTYIPPERTIVAIPLKSEPFFVDGRYELRLMVPQDPAARIADLRDLKVIIDETPIINDVRRIER